MFVCLFVCVFVCVFVSLFVCVSVRVYNVCVCMCGRVFELGGGGGERQEMKCTMQHFPAVKSMGG